MHPNIVLIKIKINKIEIIGINITLRSIAHILTAENDINNTGRVPRKAEMLTAILPANFTGKNLKRVCSLPDKNLIAKTTEKDSWKPTLNS